MKKKKTKQKTKLGKSIIEYDYERGETSEKWRQIAKKKRDK